jgi:hypothetical protein
MERLIDNATIPWGQTAKRVDIDQKIDQVWKCIRDAFLNLLDDTAAPAKCIQPPKLDEIARRHYRLATVQHSHQV